MEVKEFKQLSADFMKEYIDAHEPAYKEEFKKVALITNKNGDVRFNSAAARHAFCNHFEEFKSLLPKKKAKKPNATKTYQDW